MSFASDLFSGLAGFRDHLAELASPLVGLVEADLAKLAPLVAQDVRQAEQVAKDILHGLYSGKVITLDPPPAPVVTGGYPAPVSPSQAVNVPVPPPVVPAVSEVPAAPAVAPVAEEAAEPAHAPEDEPPTTATA